jgi:membrane-bound lytic murein transglycosylase D
MHKPPIFSFALPSALQLPTKTQVSRFYLALVLVLAGCASTPPFQTSSTSSPIIVAPPSPAVVESAVPSASVKRIDAGATPEVPAVAIAPEPIFPTGPMAPISAGEASRQGVMQLAAPADLWERIRRGFAMPNLSSELVADREQWYTTRPDYIFRMTERSRKYLFHIVEELELRNMPSELALLPFVESAFNPQAVSSAKAAGMWQFMPATGRHFELKQNAFRDDRRDVLASTRAALDYLQKLYGMFGDWHLALAAYNWGEGSVGRAIAKNKKENLGTGYLDLSMPNETRYYVPKLQAVKNIVAAPQTLNSSLPLIENHPFFQTVTITRDIDVAVAAKLAEVSVDDFKALNPSVNKPVILAAGIPQILLPWDQAAIFQRNLSKSNGTQLASWTVWVAPSTMRTADAAKKVGMSESELRDANNIPPRVMIQSGSALLVPRGNKIERDVTVQVADNGQIALSPEIVLRRNVIRAGKNETVASIATRYGVAPSSVAQWNKTSVGSSFKTGQQIVLQLPSSSKLMARASAGSSVQSRDKTVHHAKRHSSKAKRR